jgi:hypothetical protein
MRFHVSGGAQPDHSPSSLYTQPGYTTLTRVIHTSVNMLYRRTHLHYLPFWSHQIVQQTRHSGCFQSYNHQPLEYRQFPVRKKNWNVYNDVSVIESMSC